MWFFVTVVLLFRPFQVIGVKRKLVLATFLLYSLDTLYRVVLQALRINQSKSFTKQKIPFHLMFLMSISVQVYFLMKHFLSGRSRKQRATFSFKWFFRPVLATFWLSSQLFLYTQLTSNKTRKVNFWSLFPLRLLELFWKQFQGFPFSGCGNLDIRDIRMCYWCRCILAQLFCFEYCKPTKTVYNPWLLLE